MESQPSAGSDLQQGRFRAYILDGIGLCDSTVAVQYCWRRAAEYWVGVGDRGWGQHRCSH